MVILHNNLHTIEDGADDSVVSYDSDEESDDDSYTEDNDSSNDELPPLEDHDDEDYPSSTGGSGRSGFVDDSSDVSTVPSQERDGAARGANDHDDDVDEVSSNASIVTDSSESVSQKSDDQFGASQTDMDLMDLEEVDEENLSIVAEEDEDLSAVAEEDEDDDPENDRPVMVPLKDSSDKHDKNTAEEASTNEVDDQAKASRRRSIDKEDTLTRNAMRRQASNDMLAAMRQATLGPPVRSKSAVERRAPPRTKSGTGDTSMAASGGLAGMVAGLGSGDGGVGSRGPRESRESRGPREPTRRAPPRTKSGAGDGLDGGQRQVPMRAKSSAGVSFERRAPSRTKSGAGTGAGAGAGAGMMSPAGRPARRAPPSRTKSGDGLFNASRGVPKGPLTEDGLPQDKEEALEKNSMRRQASNAMLEAMRDSARKAAPGRSKSVSLDKMGSAANGTSGEPRRRAPPRTKSGDGLSMGRRAPPGRTKSGDGMDFQRRAPVRTKSGQGDSAGVTARPVPRTPRGGPPSEDEAEDVEVEVPVKFDADGDDDGEFFHSPGGTLRRKSVDEKEVALERNAMRRQASNDMLAAMRDASRNAATKAETDDSTPRRRPPPRTKSGENLDSGSAEAPRRRPPPRTKSGENLDNGPSEAPPRRRPPPRTKSGEGMNEGPAPPRRRPPPRTKSGEGMVEDEPRRRPPPRTKSGEFDSNGPPARGDRQPVKRTNSKEMLAQMEASAKPVDHMVRPPSRPVSRPVYDDDSESYSEQSSSAEESSTESYSSDEEPV